MIVLIMERIVGSHSNHYYYADLQHYLYIRRYARNGKTYYSCRIPSCAARVVANDEGVVRLANPHNHEAEEGELQKFRFLQRLRNRAASENGPLHRIYLEEEAVHHEAAINLNGYNGVRRLMQRARESSTPGVPQTLQQADEFLRDPR